MSQPPLIIGLGEILWDVLPSGPQLGGAPANFAVHAAALGGDVAVVSQVGVDELGTKALFKLKVRGIDTSYISVSQHSPTGTVQVTLDAAGVPTFEIIQNVAWDEIAWSVALQALAERADAVCFGSLGQRSEPSRSTIQRFVAATREPAWRVFDINIRPPFCSRQVVVESLELANALKLNETELPVIAEWLGLRGSDESILLDVARMYSLQAVALTLGKDGAWLWRDGELNRSPGVAAKVVDTVGAGDSFTAAWVHGMLRREPLGVINSRACQIAAYVCSQAGATPTLPEDLSRPVTCDSAPSTRRQW